MMADSLRTGRDIVNRLVERPEDQIQFCNHDVGQDSLPFWAPVFMPLTCDACLWGPYKTAAGIKRDKKTQYAVLAEGEF